jgi:hypothetical protein
VDTKRFSSPARLGVALALATALTFGAIAPASAAVIIYVRAGTGGANNGTSWADAYHDLGTALTSAVSGDQIWVAKGTYKPGASRFSSFVLKTNGVAVYGGFAGTETLLSQRQPAVNVTILSGELGAPGNGDNLYHVVMSSGTDATAVLDGFTVTGGNANGAAPDDRGGGIYADNAGLKLANVTFSNNHANVYGGSMYNVGGAPVLNNVTFYNNWAAYGTADGRGGAIYNNNSSPTLTKVTFTTNSALVEGGAIANVNLSHPYLKNVVFSGNTAAYGGAMYNEATSPALDSVTFTGNSAGQGGGMYTFNASPTLTNVTFSGNSATESYCDGHAGFGGGMMNYYDSSPTLRNVTFSGNTAACNGDGMMTDTGGHPRIYNSIFWGNGAHEIINAVAAPSDIEYSIVKGGCPTDFAPSTCDHVLNADPKLRPLAGNGGYTKTMALGAGSAAIDKGNNSASAAQDERGVTRPQAGNCDIGAYEVKAISFTSVGANDGWLLESGENSGVGGTMDAAASTLRLGDDASNRQYRTLLSFNTASLPDGASIVLARVKLKHYSFTGTNPFPTFGTLILDLKKPYFGAAPALEIGDFQAAATVGSAGTVGPTGIGGWYYGLLTSAGRAAVNKAGTTQIRLRFTLDDNNDHAAGYVSIYSGDGSLAAHRPLLIVYYNP